MAASLCLSSSSRPPFSLFNPRPPNSSKTAAAISLPLATSPAPFGCRCRGTLLFGSPTPREIPKEIRRRGCRVSAAAEDALPSPGDAQQIVSSGGDDGVSAVISVLLFVAFIGLSILTIGVIYIGVTDFLRKRESDKIEKEEAAKKKKKGGKKGKVRARARAGPKGFGQKTDEEDDEFDD